MGKKVDALLSASATQRFQLQTTTNGPLEYENSQGNAKWAHNHSYEIADERNVKKKDQHIGCVIRACASRHGLL